MKRTLHPVKDRTLQRELTWPGYGDWYLEEYVRPIDFDLSVTGVHAKASAVQKTRRELRIQRATDGIDQRELGRIRSVKATCSMLQKRARNRRRRGRRL